MVHTEWQLASAFSAHDQLLCPCAASVQLEIHRAALAATKPEQQGVRLQIGIKVEQVQMQASSSQVQDVLVVTSLASFWKARHKYAALCPDGWRTRNGPIRPWCRYADLE